VRLLKLSGPGRDLPRSSSDCAVSQFLLKRALAINLKARGPSSVELAVSSFLLALMYDVQGREREAGALYRRARRIELQLPGMGRAELVGRLQEYVDLLRSLQQFAAAKELEARIAPIMRRQGT
jgi:hypothetical protein